MAPIPCGSIAAAFAEPAPTYQLEWSIVPIGGNTAVPVAAAVDASGNVYVAQRNPQELMSFTSAGVYRFAWNLPGGNCPHQSASLDLDTNGNSYVIDFGCNRLVKYDSNRSLLWVVGGFLSPAGVNVAPDGSVYVADTFNNRIKKFDANGNLLLTWGSAGSGGGQFNTPFDVATDGAGNVYVLDSFNQRIQVFNGSGVLLRAWGDPGFGTDHLIQPMGLDVDATGNVYVADTGNHQIVKFSTTGERLTAWGGQGTGPGQMIAPNDVAVDNAGNVFVVDSGNKRIQKFTSPLVAELHVEPRALNPKSGGKWVVAYVEPPSPYVPADISVSSLTLNGVAVDPAAPVDVADIDGDGLQELVVRFSRTAIVATAPPGVSQLTLSLAGTIGGAAFAGQDVVKFIGNGDILTYDPGVSAAGVPGGELDSKVFGVRVATPNPARAGTSLVVSYQASGSERAIVEVIDLSGRRVGSAEVAAEGRGLRSTKIALQRSLAPGIYLVRVTQGANLAATKFAVLR